MDNIVLERIWKRSGTLYVDCIDGNLYTGEEQAHTFRITGQDEHGTVTPITGTITGKFLRADNLDVPLVGSLDGGVAVLTLTEQCYDCRGRYVLSIFADDGEHKICIYCGTGNVFRTDGEATIDPSNIIQDVSDLIDRIQTAIGQIPADYSALTARVTQTETDVSDLKSALREAQILKNCEGDADLYISDENGYVLAKFENGGFETKKLRGYDYKTFSSETESYTGSALTLTVAHHFFKGDHVVLHVERGAMPWEYGAKVTYYCGDKIIKNDWRGDCTYIEYVLEEDADEFSAVYPANSTYISSGTNLTFEVSLIGDVPIKPTVVTIKKDGTGDFDNLRGCLDDIGVKANDVLNPYRIEIYPGTYDVLADYTDAEISAAAYTQTDFVGPKLLNGISLVGIGLPGSVVLTASLDPNTWSNTIRGAISTLNLQGTCSIENLTVIAHNIRYCVHDDYHAPLGKKPKRVVKNCIFRGDNVSYTPGTTYGAGTSPTGCDFEFINCDFGENAGVHTMPTTQFRSFIHLVNCVGSGFRIGDKETMDIATSGYSIVRFDGCGFPWIRNSVDGEEPHIIICGSGNRSPVYQLTDDTQYITDDITVVPNSSLQFNSGVGTVVEWYSDTDHGPRFRVATSSQKAKGIVVYQDNDNTHIQTRGYVSTNRTSISSVLCGDYIGVSDSEAVVVSDRNEAFAIIKFVDSSGVGYMLLD